MEKQSKKRAGSQRRVGERQQLQPKFKSKARPYIGGGNLLQVPQDDDVDSMENHTNLNWETGETSGHRRRSGDTLSIVESHQSIRVADDPLQREVSARELYQESHFYIDQLKDELCTPEADGKWLVFKKPQEEPTEVKGGRWTKEEHQAFLEGIQLVGKDWAKLATLIKTRSIKNVISHAQKFLGKLVRFLSKEEALKEMTLEEAEYFHGVLSKRVTHWCAKRKIKRQEAKEELKTKGLLFYTEKVTRRKPADGQAPSNLELSQPTEQEPQATLEEAKEESEYFRWAQEKELKSQMTWSLKIQKETDQDFQFLPVFNYEDAAEDGGSDSGASQSSGHKLKFYVDDGFSNFKEVADLHRQMTTKIFALFSQLPDIDNEDDPPRVIWHVRPGLEFVMFENQSLDNFLTNADMHGEHHQNLQRTHPKLLASILRRMQAKMDSSSEQTPDPMLEFFQTLDATGLEELVTSTDMHFFYKKDTSVEGHLSEMMLDESTNALQKKR